MRRLRSLGVLGALLATALFEAGSTAIAPRSSHAGATGTIVFASDRAKFDPGEIYSLALARAPRDVSRSLAGDYGLAVAPTGDQIAFWSGRTGTDRVYLARSDGSHLRRVGGELLSRTRGSGGALVFSADGAQLYATSYSSPGAYMVDTRRATARRVPACAGIARPSPDGTLVACGVNGKTVVSDLAGHVRFTLPAINGVWSSRGWLTSAPPINEGAVHTPSAVVVDPSGRVRARFSGLPLGFSPDGSWLVLQRAHSLWVAGPGDFTRLRMLLPEWPAGLLSFTPDSRFVSTESNGSPVLVPLGGGGTLPGLDYGAGTWSRDGRLAYAGYRQAFADATRPGVTVAVFVTDTHGRNPRVVGRFPFDDHNYSDLRWLPDGRSVLFLTGTSCGGSGLFAVPAGGGATRRLDRDPRNRETPTWSPGGKRIAVSVENFTCHLGAGLPSHIATVAADGSDARRVTDDGDPQLGSFDRFPSFSPDGSRIVFAHGSFNSSSIQVTDARGGGERTALDSLAGMPAWSPDGARIAYADGRTIKAVAASGGAPEMIATGLPAVSCGSGGLAWSPDGTRIAVGRGAGIYLITVGEPASARLAIRVACAGNPSFSPDGEQIAFDAPPAHPLGEQSAIMVARVDGTGIRTLSTVPFRQSVHPSWQPAQ
jgi:Tol biopolymer transport system component